MLVSLEEVEPLLRSPVTGGRLKRCEASLVDEADTSSRFAFVGHAPVLVDFDRSIFSPSDLLDGQAVSQVARPRFSGLRSRLKRLLSPPKRVTSENVDEFIRLLLRDNDNPVVLVVGGGTVGQGMAPLYEHPNIRVLALDVYASPLAQLVADAHQIPLADASIDGVVVQAVLEHVLEPQVVVDEIWRVLRPGGIAYAETPFLQHVHEGAYDFLRFTASGHRWLFRRFEAIRTGVCGGAGTQMLWSIDYFVRGLFRSVAAGKAAKLSFFWLALLDPLVPAAYANDAASGFYLMGRKTETSLKPREMASAYRGAQA
ncbi:class I SAM-dependent methyltransferase [Sphingomonas sp. IC4-52]|uniref:class I SAM-dependent methyltransferase n=1 Tax=Sphingomonas sp. IC4-52 TaxID=2887202 RepID=UPI001D1049C4|nr:class I SAM-dependent methyltransferase [Sphingomonas sp. IC4-52]MCC2978602.1 class I SAM-dependent methyltransferase [Sphingomonas sp. IC4-52]